MMIPHIMDGSALQSKVDKLSEALRSSQKQAKQADAEAQEMEKAFRVLQTEVNVIAATILVGAACMPQHAMTARH